ncbi:ArsR/SmtB family transcription factor [Halomarina ordinaria]|uniref:ArsR/SmtB family transcription factor n=1 Tax=Halomarina ordinaria TaxID=3033939 RepID=A0ABD5UKM1_9EURY|nr:winged helix-turn-helix domain-containing protein [Halomarina sp. PSRA2]
MSDGGPDDLTVLDYLGDEVARNVLVACADGTRNVSELAGHCDVSEATIYRRLNRLIEAGLLEERTRIGKGAVSGGKEYRTAVRHVAVDLDAEGVSVRVDDPEGGDEPLPTFTVFDPNGRDETGTRVVDIQLKLPEHLFSEFLSVWAELNRRAERDDVDHGSMGDLAE